MQRLWSHQRLAVAPRPFKRALGRYRSDFQGYDQQDAHEFLLAVLSAVHEDTNRRDPEETKKKKRRNKKEVAVEVEKPVEKSGGNTGEEGSKSSSILISEQKLAVKSSVTKVADKKEERKSYHS